MGWSRNQSLLIRTDFHRPKNIRYALYCALCACIIILYFLSLRFKFLVCVEKKSFIACLTCEVVAAKSGFCCCCCPKSPVDVWAPNPPNPPALVVADAPNAGAATGLLLKSPPPAVAPKVLVAVAPNGATAAVLVALPKAPAVDVAPNRGLFCAPNIVL